MVVLTKKKCYYSNAPKYILFYFYSRLIDSSVVFKVLYSLLTYGTESNDAAAMAAGYNPLDQPEDMLRLRLVCTILDTCGAYFVSGSSKTKLRYFLAYFQVRTYSYVFLINNGYRGYYLF